MKSLKKIEFDAECYLEGSWGSRSLGRRNCSLEIFSFDKKDYIQIEFCAGEDVEHIGIWYNENTREILDYDGVFSVPQEAVDMLKGMGFCTEAIE